MLKVYTKDNVFTQPVKSIVSTSISTDETTDGKELYGYDIYTMRIKDGYQSSDIMGVSLVYNVENILKDMTENYGTVTTLIKEERCLAFYNMRDNCNMRLQMFHKKANVDEVEESEEYIPMLSELNIEYSYNMFDWYPLIPNEKYEVRHYEAIYLRGKNVDKNNNGIINNDTAEGYDKENAWYQFVFDGSNNIRIDCKGDITRLLDYEAEPSDVNVGGACFYNLFKDTPIISTPTMVSRTAT